MRFSTSLFYASMMFLGIAQAQADQCAGPGKYCSGDEGIYCCSHYCQDDYTCL
ncbi:hypothetical protein PT974_06973 [Cladobotryum mycophilum]|uniref:Uncharacterized protein n=1 Tax=Cladobotryum mycophilum TaxID=491253 RepID=A0ABR0SN65_9HYPO